MIGYELWDMRSGNLLESFDSEAEALAAVVRTVRTHGPASVETFALAGIDDDEDIVPMARGAELLARARGDAGIASTGGAAGSVVGGPAGMFGAHGATGVVHVRDGKRVG